MPNPTLSNFFDIEDLNALLNLDLSKQEALMVGISGGADSLGLLHMLCHWSKEVSGPIIHGVTIDHGLREESAEEAKKVAQITQDFPNYVHKILRWEEDKPETKLQENARFVRYDLLASYARTQNIQVLFVAHHEDDQGETFLIRLAKGSGLDGLACMEKVFVRADGFMIARPLLDVSHESLKEYCRTYGLDWIEDPSNENEKFLRPRLRAARNVLEVEGLTNKRLSTTAYRLLRAKKALDNMAQEIMHDIVKLEADGAVIHYPAWQSLSEEFRVRVIQNTFLALNPSQTYAPRMEKVENLAEALFDQEAYKTQTLNGQIISLKKDGSSIIFKKE